MRKNVRILFLVGIDFY